MDLEKAQTRPTPVFIPYISGDVQKPLNNSFELPQTLQLSFLLKTLDHPTLDSQKNPRTHTLMADNNGDGGAGAVIDRPEDEGGPMEVETGEQTQTQEGAVVGSGEVATGDGYSSGDREQEFGDEPVWRTPNADPRATEEPRAADPVVETLDQSTAVEGSIVAGIGSGGAGGSDVGSGDDIGPNGSPPRDSAKGKGTVTEEGETTEVPLVYREEDVLFWPAATS